MDIPLSLHTGTNRPGSTLMRTEGEVTQTGVDRSNTDYWVRMSMGHMIFSGIFERYPTLRVVNVEHDLAWIPYYMQRMDVTYIERPTQAYLSLQGRHGPQRLSCAVTSITASRMMGLGIRDRDIIGSG